MSDLNSLSAALAPKSNPAKLRDVVVPIRQRTDVSVGTGPRPAPSRKESSHAPATPVLDDDFRTLPPHCDGCNHRERDARGCGRAFEDPDSTKPGAPEPTHAVSAAELRLKEDVGYLAADAREGRAPGTKGSRRPPTTSRGSSRRPGSSPRRAPTAISRRFTIGGDPRLRKITGAGVRRARRQDDRRSSKSDFTPLAIGVGATLEKVPIVFAGYGITAHDDARKLDYDDYAGIDVKGKAVLIIRREPRDDDKASPFDASESRRRHVGPPFSSFQHKATNAFQHGAAAVLLVNDRSDGRARARTSCCDFGREPGTSRSRTSRS